MVLRIILLLMLYRIHSDNSTNKRIMFKDKTEKRNKNPAKAVYFVIYHSVFMYFYFAKCCLEFIFKETFLS